MDKRSPNTTHRTDAQRIDWLRLIRSDRVGPHGVMAQTPQGPKMGRNPRETATLWLFAYLDMYRVRTLTFVG